MKQDCLKTCTRTQVIRCSPTSNHVLYWRGDDRRSTINIQWDDLDEGVSIVLLAGGSYIHARVEWDYIPAILWKSTANDQGKFHYQVHVTTSLVCQSSRQGQYPGVGAVAADSGDRYQVTVRHYDQTDISRWHHDMCGVRVEGAYHVGFVCG